MLELKKLIGEGGVRRCYFHPEDANLCVKVDKVDNKQTARERKYFRRLQNKNVKMDNFIAQFVTMVETNFGMGGVYEVVKDYDGNVSKTLHTYLLKGGLSQSLTEQIHAALSRLKTKLMEQLVVTMNICPDNLAVKFLDENSIELVIIDDIGSPVLIPLEYYFSSLARAKIERKWKRFKASMMTQYKFEVRV